MKKFTLGDVCQKASSNIAQKDLLERTGKYPVFGASGFIKNIDFYHQKEEYIAIVKDGSGIGRTMLLPAYSSVIGTMQYLIPTKKYDIDIRYLYYAILYMNLSKYYSGSAIPHIYFRDYKIEPINIPCINKQKKISKKLNSIDVLIELRKKQLLKLDVLVKSRFVEMFGDLKTNSKKWNISSFNNFAVIDTSMTTDFEKYADYPHIGIDSIEKNTGELKGYRTVKEDNVISGKYVFTNKHIIYSKIRPNLNKVAIPTFNGLCSADSYPILPIEYKCTRIFLAYVMRSEFFLEYILQFSTRTNLPKVNKKELQGFCSPLPPLPLQEQFSSFVQQVDKSKFLCQFTLKRFTDILFAQRRHLYG